jgi:hypothetical protein
MAITGSAIVKSPLESKDFCATMTREVTRKRLKWDLGHYCGYAGVVNLGIAERTTAVWISTIGPVEEADTLGRQW